jgi:outer membrane protein OmpA-like peptidoglycan-associated protein
MIGLGFMKRCSAFALLSMLLSSRVAYAERPRAHVTAGFSHAVGGSQSREFSWGGSASGTVEFPFSPRLGGRAGAAVFALSEGDPPSMPGLAPTSMGLALFTTAGLHVRFFSGERRGGPWLDGGLGLAFTGGLARPAFESRIGWAFAASRPRHFEFGPFLGYAHIVQPNDGLRESDARILTFGLSISFGGTEPPAPAKPLVIERIPTPPPVVPPEEPELPEHDGDVESSDLCPDGEPPTAEGCGDGVRLFEGRILLEDVVHFEFDSAKIRPRSRHVVKDIADFLLAHPELDDVSLEGHADNVGSVAYNTKLSEARAQSMKALLVSFGVEASRLRVVAHGSSQPRVDTSRPEIRNRRVELYVTKKSQGVSK